MNDRKTAIAIIVATLLLGGYTLVYSVCSSQADSSNQCAGGCPTCPPWHTFFEDSSMTILANQATCKTCPSIIWQCLATGDNYTSHLWDNYCVSGGCTNNSCQSYNCTPTELSNPPYAKHRTELVQCPG